MKKIIDTSIFRDYDIRGIYPDQLNPDTFYILGRAVADFFKVKKIALGRDCRLSSPALFTAMSLGIMDQGTDVVDLGMISTEMHYFASGKYDFPANIIISASHNPGNYNGIKIVKQGAIPLHGGFGLPGIKKIAIAQNFPVPSKKGTLTKMSIMEDWIRHALTFINIKKVRPLSVVVDAGNGMGGISWERLKGKIPVRIMPLYFKPDGAFPHHLPDPSKKENIADLQKEVKEANADLGFALDGDADRIFVLDEKGRMLSGTITTSILASALIEKFGKGVILYNAVCGRIVPETVKRLGGRSLRVRVGHSFIKEQMRNTHALFAGEHSGHFYFRDNFYADSSLIAGLIILEYISKADLPVSKIAEKFDKYPASGEINFKVSFPDKLINKLKTKYKDAASIDEIDGLSVWYPNFWFNLRASKTEAFVRLNLEAISAKILKEQLKKVESLIILSGGKKV